MLNRFDLVREELERNPKHWLITGVAGFVGSNLLEALLKLNQHVVGLDNFMTGYRHNLDEVRDLVTSEQWARFRFIEGDIRNSDDCAAAVDGVDYVLHQAALGSVPRSVHDPLTTHDVNNSGFLRMMVAARDARVKSFTYAASSSTYGDHPDLPKVEEKIGRPLSPYAVTKLCNEIYAEVFSRTYGFDSVGLRYFNVFGQRQDPNGAYAAVIPLWTAALIRGDDVYINGDGETSRDFCFVDNAVKANLLAATAEPSAKNQVYNVAVGDRTTLNDLYKALQETLATQGVFSDRAPKYREFRIGDVRHSQASVEKAERLLGYTQRIAIREGLLKTMPWYVRSLRHSNHQLAGLDQA